MNKIINLSDNEKIEFILNFEYGYILNGLENKNWIVKIVNFDDLIIGNNYVKMSKEILEKYKNKKDDLPIGIYSEENNKYRLIDGFHRYFAIKDRKVKKVKIITTKN